MPKPVAFFPLNGKFTTNDEQRRPQLKASASNAILTTGPNNEPQGAYQFCGNSNSYIEFPNSHGILDVKQSMTLMCWVRPGGKDGPLFNYNKAGAWGVHIWIANGRFFNRIPKYDSHAFLNHIQTDQPLAGLAGGKWIHVAATYDHNTGVNSIYLDGVLSKTQNIGTGFRISTNDRAVRMGAKIGDGRYFKGAITQMRSYDVALTAQQILVVRNQGNYNVYRELLRSAIPTYLIWIKMVGDYGFFTAVNHTLILNSGKANNFITYMYKEK